MPEPTDVEPTAAEMTVFTHKVDTMEEVLLPPLKGILLEGKGEASAELIISISAKDITEPGFAPKKAPAAPQKMKKHESPFNDGGGIPTGAIKSSIAAPVVINETDEDIYDHLDLYHEGIINTLHLNRTLYRDGYYNTLCLPFDFSAAEIAASQLAGGILYEYVSASKGESGLDVIIQRTNDIKAAVPYLIKWAPTEPEIIEKPLIFHDVHIKEVEGKTIGETEEIRFVGHIAMEQIPLENRNNLFVGTENTLYWPDNTNSKMKGFRAYFAIPASSPSGAPIKRGTPARLVERQNSPTDIESVQHSANRIQKIVKENQLVIIRDGKYYNVLGGRIQ